MVFFPAVITFTIKILWYWIHIDLMVRNGNSIAWTEKRTPLNMLGTMLVSD
jgi:hypothetical protein